MERRFRQKIPTELRTDLEMLATIDPNGMSFRYTTIKSKHGVSWVSLPGEFWVTVCARAACSGRVAAQNRNRKVPLEPHSRPRRFSANWVFSGVAFWYSPGKCGIGRPVTETSANRKTGAEPRSKLFHQSPAGTGSHLRPL